MAKEVLPVDFKDDVLAEGTLRKYKQIDNGDGTVSFQDVTNYSQVGSTFGQAQINATNKAVNESVDKAAIIETMEDLAAVTEKGFVPDALLAAELNKKISGISGFVIDETTGEITGYTTEIGGADTVFPFSSSEISILSTTYAWDGNNNLEIKISVPGKKRMRVSSLSGLSALWIFKASTNTRIHTVAAGTWYDISEFCEDIKLYYYWGGSGSAISVGAIEFE